MNPLAQLRDIELPRPISFWPLAPGWYVLVALLVVVAALLFLFWRRRRKRFIPHKKALIVLEEIKMASHARQDDVAFLNEITSLLKRTLFVDNLRKDIASLHGQDWLEFLDKKSKTTDFTQGPGRVLASGQYQAAVNVDRNSLLKVIENLIKSC